eukprot:TRINITY_DN69391_c0_g1_i1.p1 TRINITY_DN69391_c0_g1~~TRINITY_DN69391_c0_g1_i1.p1  ORF type:complete len:559 (-),score=156.44 TRINITY_DN69391_c0_g1_i1:113-1543(-)
MTSREDERLLSTLSCQRYAQMSIDELANSLVDSETSYVRDVLKSMMEFSKRAQMNEVLDSHEVEVIFSNVADLCKIHDSFLKQLKSVQWGPHWIEDIGSIFIKMAQFFKVYAHYICNFQLALSMCKELESKREKFSRLKAEHLAVTGMRLESQLELPTNRIEAYLVYLQALGDKLPQSKSFQISLNQVKEVLETISLQVKDIKCRDAVVRVQVEILKNKVSLVDPARILIDEIDMLMWEKRPASLFSKACVTRKVKVQVFLFNDVMLICRSAKVKKILRLFNCSVEKMSEESNCLQIEGGMEVKLVLESYTAPLFDFWFNLIQSSILEQKGSLIGAHISDEEFEEMVMKKSPAVPLVDPEAILQFSQATSELINLRRVSNRTVDSQSEDKSCDILAQSSASSLTDVGVVRIRGMMDSDDEEEDEEEYLEPDVKLETTNMFQPNRTRFGVMSPVVLTKQKTQSADDGGYIVDDQSEM